MCTAGSIHNTVNCIIFTKNRIFTQTLKSVLKTAWILCSFHFLDCCITLMFSAPKILLFFVVLFVEINNKLDCDFISPKLIGSYICVYTCQ